MAVVFVCHAEWETDMAISSAVKGDHLGNRRHSPPLNKRLYLTVTGVGLLLILAGAWINPPSHKVQHGPSVQNAAWVRADR